MAKRKSAKAAFLSSAVAMLMSCSMFVGATFAWFTDSVTSANNIITSGNLDVELEYWNGSQWEDVNNKSDVLTNTLWEPGVTEVAYLRVANVGSLALKYQLGINIVSETEGKNVAGETFKLSDYIEFGVIENVNGEVGAYATREAAAAAVTEAKKISEGYTKTDAMTSGQELYLALVVYMPTEVGNEANHDGKVVPQIDLGINIFATQYTYEDDSFGSDYDEDATLPDTWDGTSDTSWYSETENTFKMSTAEQLAGLSALAANGNTFKGKTIVLNADMNLDGQNWTAIKKFTGKFDGNNHTVSNFNIDATAGNAGFFTSLNSADGVNPAIVENLTLSNVTAKVGNYRFGTIVSSVNKTNLNNITVKNLAVTTTASKSFVAGLVGYGTVNSEVAMNNCTVEDFTVNAEKGAMLIGGITTFIQRNGTEADGTNVFDNLHVKNFKVVVNDNDDFCGIGGLVGQTQTVWQNPRFNNCSVSGLDITASGSIVDVGGFMCYPGSVTFAENCTVEGKIDVSGVTSSGRYAGGFFGDLGWGDNIGKGDHKVTNCSADVDIITKVARAGGFVGSATNSENKNKNATFISCEAKGTITIVEGGNAHIGGFVGYADRGIYINCVSAQAPFIGMVADGYTLNDDNGTLTVSK